MKCKECGQEFEVSAKEEKFFKDKGLETPKRCRECRLKRRIERERRFGNEVGKETNN